MKAETVAGRRTRALLARYVAECPYFWRENTDKRQCDKLWRHLAAIEEHFGLGVDDALDTVVGFGESRLAARPATVYVSGRGGSGSHWLAEMLGDLEPFADAGEVSIPNRLARAIMAWPLEEQGLLADCVHLLHAWVGQPEGEVPTPHPGIAGMHVVNSNGDSKPLLARLWEPNCIFIHLIRDPRDQVLSFTHRKPTARANYQVASTEDFLRLMLIFNRISLSQVLSAPVGPDLVCRYEDLRTDASRLLENILGIVDVEVESERIAEVAFRHSADARRRGVGAPMGNLSQTPTKSWRASATEEERLLLHAGLAEVVDTFGYEPDDCGVRPLDFVPLKDEFAISLPDDVALGEIHLRRKPGSSWERAGHAAGQFVLPAGVMVRLRCAGGWTTGFDRLVDLLPAGCLSSVCFAGNGEVTDRDLAALARTPGLIGLDLARTRVTDACVESLIQLRELRQLSVIGTAISDDTLQRLRTALPNCEIAAGRLITDAIRGHGWFPETLITDPPGKS